MRKLRRWWRGFKAERSLAGRRAQVKLEVERMLGGPVRLRERGNLGHDSNYDVFQGERQVAVLRLVNPHKQRPTPPAGMPFRIEAPPARLAHEWEALTRAAAADLAPRPLWRAEDAILCEYLPYETLTAEAQRRPDRVWTFLSEASAALDRLHREVGLAHMDASLSNILTDDGHGRFALVDFEYTAAPDVAFPQQRIYDHLRLLQATGKFVPAGLKGAHGPWFEQLAGYLDDDMRAASLDRIVPALTHLLAVEAYRTAAKRVLPRLP